MQREIADEEQEQIKLNGLLARAAQRDEAAFAELYDYTAARAYAVALRITGDRTRAEDVVAESYLQIWQQAGRYEPARGRAIAWMLVIVRSRALDERRRRDPAESHPDPTELGSEPAYGNDPLNVTLTIERHGQLYDALRRLDSTQMQLLSLAFFRGLSHQEIAAHCNMPLGSVKTLLRKAAQTLKTMLEHEPVNLPELP